MSKSDDKASEERGSFIELEAEVEVLKLCSRGASLFALNMQRA